MKTWLGWVPHWPTTSLGDVGRREELNEDHSPGGLVEGHRWVDGSLDLRAFVGPVDVIMLWEFSDSSSR